jgi:hypothetical protein
VGYRIASSLNAPGEPPSGTAEVEVVKLDDLVERGAAQPPNVVMIDVEGAEIAVLRGMAGIIERNRPTILCEVHWIQTELDAFVQEVLSPLGYSVTQLDGSPLPTELTRYHALMRPDPGAQVARKGHTASELHASRGLTAGRPM